MSSISGRRKILSQVFSVYAIRGRPTCAATNLLARLNTILRTKEIDKGDYWPVAPGRSSDQASSAQGPPLMYSDLPFGTLQQARHP